MTIQEKIKNQIKEIKKTAKTDKDKAIKEATEYLMYWGIFIEDNFETLSLQDKYTREELGEEKYKLIINRVMREKMVKTEIYRKLKKENDAFAEKVYLGYINDLKEDYKKGKEYE